jgi:hypothetical protein
MKPKMSPRSNEKERRNLSLILAESSDIRLPTQFEVSARGSRSDFCKNLWEGGSCFFGQNLKGGVKVRYTFLKKPRHPPPPLCNYLVEAEPDLDMRLRSRPRTKDTHQDLSRLVETIEVQGGFQDY